MRKVWQQLMLLFTICLLFAQALFGSITVSATANEPLTIILTTEGEPYIEGHIALNPVTIQMATSSIDSEGMQVEWSVNEGDTWEIFDMMDPLVLTDAGDYSIWFRIIGQPNISKHTIRVAGSQPSLLSESNSIIYVNLNTVEGSNDGTNWVNAFDNLQSALDKAQSGDQIWIAQGTYTPTRKVNGNDPRSATFQMKNGVGIYGGFKGDETTLAERDFETYKTILSGALPNGSSAYHVFFHSYFLELDKTAVLDGVTITKGNANGSTMDLYGGGMFNISRNSPTLTNVNFYGNKAGLQGGGLYNHSESNPILTNVTFTENEAGFQGGAIYNYNSGPTFQDVIFEKNKTTGSQSEGGGIYNYGSSPILTNVTFIENEAENKGGAMSNTKQSNPSLTGVSFDGNKALISGKGGGMYNSESSPMLTNVQFNKNVASYDGGGIANEMSNPTLIDVLFTSNTASSYGAGMYNASSDPSLDNVIFIGNETFMYGGGMYNDNSNPTLTNVTFSENKAGYGGGIFITGRDSTPVIRNTRFNNNQALQIGGGVFTSNYSSPSFDEVKINQNRAINGAGMHNQDSSPIIMNTLFSGNTANYGGGAMSNNGSSSPILTNTTLTSNDAYIGGGLFNQDNSSPNLRNVLFTGNKAEFEGASISNDSPNSNIILTNVTISGDIPRYGESAIYGGDLVSKIQNTIIIGNSRKIAISNYKGKVENSLLDVQVGRNVRGKLIDGDGNTTDTSNYIPTDIFMDSSKKDYRLKVDSPAIDRGKVNYPELADVTTDIAGNKRIQGITIDLGVYEVTPFYSVIYDANEATAGQVPEDSAQYEENQTVTVQGNVGQLMRTGYTFTGWNTKVDGKGIAYKANDTFRIGTTNVILYAQWTKKQTATYTVTYDANEATAGQVPEDSTRYEENQTVTVQGNSGHLEKAGYTFVGWNTKVDGKGIAYKANDTFQIGTTNVILYAQWTKKQTATYTVTYDANEATAGQVPEDSAQYKENQTVTVQGNVGQLMRTGYTFTGWNTKADGKGIAYKANDTFQIGTTNVILYAQWTKKQTATYTVTYDANEATGGQVPEDSTQYEENQTVTVQENSGHLEKAGYTFVGWNTKADGKGIAYKANDTFQIGTSNVILYAQWAKKQTATYTVTYDANEATGGQVPEDSAQYEENQTVTVQGNSGHLEKAGYTFVGWNIKADGKGIAYKANDTFQMGTTNVILYAQLTKKQTATYTVTYDANEATAGQVPEDSTRYEENQTVTVQGNSGHLEKAGYTFVGWNTKADGTGTVYKANETFPIGKVHVILYAQWIVNPPSSGDNTTSPNDNDYSSLSTVKITFHTNGGTLLPPQEITYNTKIRDLPLPTKDGFRFDGWYEDAAFKIEWDEDTVIRKNIVIYAKWIPLLVDESDTPLPKEMVRFYDMDSHWAKEIVEELAILKIIHGYEDGTFRPNEPISRMHVAVLFARAFEFESIRSAKAFSDIATNHVYYEEINTLQQAGIIDGMGDTFHPVEAITRAQVAKILAKTLRLPSEGTSSFSDVSSNHWSTGYIAALEQAGIAFESNGEFHPDVPVTRAELATFLYRALQF